MIGNNENPTTADDRVGLISRARVVHCTSHRTACEPQLQDPKWCVGVDMTDDINWREKCKRVAEWLGALSAAPRGCGAYLPYAFDPMFVGDDCIAWPDYTQSDAAAMRLQQRLPDSVDAEAERWGVKAHDLFISPFSYTNEWNVFYDYGDAASTVVDVGHKDLRKALVLAACELIDMGVEPREVAR